MAGDEKINCLIVDDEPLAQEILEGYLNRRPDLTLIAKCSTAMEAFERLTNTRIDLLFLDVKMPAVNGLDLIKTLKNPPAVIFTTAFSEYAAESYDLNAVDYLLKPITYDRFCKSIDKLNKIKPVSVAQEKDYTYFKTEGQLIKVKHTDILYVQSIKDYILIYTVKNNLIVHMTMKYLVELLPLNSFLRIHRSYLVNRFHLQTIGKNQVVISGLQIPVGESYRPALLQLQDELS